METNKACIKNFPAQAAAWPCHHEHPAAQVESAHPPWGAACEGRAHGAGGSGAAGLLGGERGGTAELHVAKARAVDGGLESGRAGGFGAGLFGLRGGLFCAI